MQAWELLEGLLRLLAPSLQRLDLQWFGRMESLRWVAPLRALTQLELDAHTLRVTPHLAGLPCLAKLALYTVEGGLAWGAEPPAQQPPGGEQPQPALPQLEPGQLQLQMALGAFVQQQQQQQQLAAEAGGGQPPAAPPAAPEACPLPATLRGLSIMHADPLSLPASLGTLRHLSRLYLSECVLGESDFPGVLLQATGLQVRMRGGLD